MSSFRGIFVRIRNTDHAQIIIPGINTATEIQVRARDGPPTLKMEGQRMFVVNPAIRNGRVNSPIFLPLPTRIFNFIIVVFIFFSEPNNIST
jgi:hypothetical protein